MKDNRFQRLVKTGRPAKRKTRLHKRLMAFGLIGVAALGGIFAAAFVPLAVSQAAADQAAEKAETPAALPAGDTIIVFR